MSRAGVDAAAGAGRTAPDFCLPATTGEGICLRDLLAEGAVLLWFYRGHW